MRDMWWTIWMGVCGVLVAVWLLMRRVGDGDGRKDLGSASGSTNIGCRDASVMIASGLWTQFNHSEMAATRWPPVSDV